MPPILLSWSMRRGDVGRDFAFVFPDEDAVGIGGDVRVYVFGFACSPICVGKLTEVFFDVLVNRYPVKADNGDCFEGVEVFRAVFSDHGMSPLRTDADEGECEKDDADYTDPCDDESYDCFFGWFANFKAKHDSLLGS